MDPGEVLGLMAQNPQDRMKYAKIEARLQFQRTANEIAFANAFEASVKQLYPHLKPIDAAYAHSIQADYTDGVSSNPLNPTTQAQEKSTLFAESGDIFLLFTNVSSPQGDLVLSQLLSAQSSTSGLVIDIYILGTNDAGAVESWAKSNNIPVAAVNNHQINLDFDRGELAKVMGGYSTHYSLPVLVRQRGTAQTVMSGSFNLDGSGQ
jgi:integrating conjugative element protein (TIGR03759 family)